MTKHTSGPWVIDAHKFELAIEPNVALVEGISPANWANARLIAAAPELLAALELALKHLPGVMQDGILVDNHISATIRAAIARATGDA